MSVTPIDNKSRKAIVKLIEKGKPTAYIMERFPDFTRQQIAGVRAVLTRTR